MPIRQRALMRPCRHHGYSNGKVEGCYYCYRKYLSDTTINGILRPEERLLREIFGESRFLTVKPKKPRRKRS